MLTEAMELSLSKDDNYDIEKYAMEDLIAFEERDPGNYTSYMNSH